MSNEAPEGAYSSTVPQGEPMMQSTPQTSPIHGLHDSAPAPSQSIPPAKPDAVTGPGGSSVSIPKAGKPSA